uniref:BRCT domain-containing protein n=1 Tax=Macrostomum lignano TaxID=282301 RepID=A0A1I8FMY1_9PLAT
LAENGLRVRFRQTNQQVAEMLAAVRFKNKDQQLAADACVVRFRTKTSKLAEMLASATAVYENGPPPLPDGVVRVRPVRYDGAQDQLGAASTPNGSRESFLLELPAAENCGLRTTKARAGIYENEPRAAARRCRRNPARRRGLPAVRGQVRHPGQAALHRRGVRRRRPSAERRVVLELANDSGAVRETVRRSATMSARWGAQTSSSASIRSRLPTARAVSAWQQAGSQQQPAAPKPAATSDPQTGEFVGPARPPAVRAQPQQQLGAEEPKAPCALRWARAASTRTSRRSCCLTWCSTRLAGAASLRHPRARQRRKRQLLLRQREAEEAARAGRPGMPPVSKPQQPRQQQQQLDFDYSAPVSDATVSESQPTPLPDGVVRSGAPTPPTSCRRPTPPVGAAAVARQRGGGGRVGRTESRDCRARPARAAGRRQAAAPGGGKPQCPPATAPRKPQRGDGDDEGDGEIVGEGVADELPAEGTARSLRSLFDGLASSSSRRPLTG